jgi:hypothetical protein
MRRCIVINEWFNPNEQGNPYHCDDCNETYAVKENITYAEHISEIAKKYEKNEDDKYSTIEEFQDNEAKARMNEYLDG